MKSQRARILKHLQKGKPLTPLQALKLFNCLRLSGRILELRKAGWQIDTEAFHTNGKTVARYWLRQNKAT